MSFRYTVTCRFHEANPEIVRQWLAWLTDGHLADVLAAGAQTAEIVAMDADRPTYEIRYSFSSRTEWDRYVRDHAPRLRAEGLQLFPLELGLAYERSSGDVVLQMP